MSTHDGWIKMSERKPTRADLPVWWAYSPDGDPEVELSRELLHWLPDVYWQPATLPEPPKKELTQREKDEEEFRSFFLRMRGDSEAETVWLAALAYRDKQNAEDLLGLTASGPFASSEEMIKLNRLRHRCGLDK